MPQHAARHRLQFDATIMEEELPERREAGSLLKRCTVALEGLGAQWRRGLTVNAHERLALLHLWESGPMTMSELGERIPLSRAAITALTDRLERMGYLVRTPDEHDRRRTVLSLTGRQYDVVLPLLEPFHRDMEELAARFDDGEWAVVSSFLDDVHRIAHRHAKALRELSDDELHEQADARRVVLAEAAAAAAAGAGANGGGRVGAA